MQIQINNEQLLKKLQAAASKLEQPAELMDEIQKTLVSETLLNFHSQGRPKWAGLSPYTLKRRKGGMILQDTSGLSSSVQGSFTADTATVGAGGAAVRAGHRPSSVYAAIHQFGGKAGRNQSVNITARPYLPMDKNGNLQPEAAAAIEDICDIFMSDAF